MPTINPRDRSITLTVKAKELFNETNYPPREDQMDANTSLLEDGGLESRYGDANKDFETIVFLNKQICWSIAESDPNGVDRGYTVALVEVFHNPTAGNPNFFNRDPLPVNRGTGQVCGNIATNPNLPIKDDSYTIQFTIADSRTTKTYNLDPKLKINQIN
jgi:hypothetical protein